MCKYVGFLNAKQLMEVVVSQGGLRTSHKAVDLFFAPELVNVSAIRKMQLAPMEPKFDARPEQGIPNGPQPLQEVRIRVELVEHEIHLVH